jgi:micrococcal nuclease
VNRRYPRPRRGEPWGRRTLNQATLRLGLLFIVLLLGAALLPAVLDSPQAPAPDDTRALVPVEGATLVSVVRIIDGDTLTVAALSDELTVRLFGVDTPERGERCYREATDRLAALAGTQVQLLPDERLQDRFGRELRYVYSVDGVLIDEALVAEGYGVAWRQDGQFREQIMAAEAEARAAARGCLWGQ